MTAETPIFANFDDAFGQDAIVNATRALKIVVNGTGILEMDQYVLHPFVRIHILDIRNRRYLSKQKPEQPGTSYNESFNCFEYDVGSKKKMPQ